jgi:hypothetical protein
MFLLPVLAIVICLIAVRAYRDHGYKTAAKSGDVTSTGSDTSESTAPVVDDRRLTDPAAQERGADPSDSSVDPSDPPAEKPEPETPAPSTPALSPDTDTPAPTDPDPSESSQPAATESDAATDEDSDAALAQSGAVTVLSPNVSAIAGSPARFTTSQPMGAFLLALAERDLSAANNALQAMHLNPALGLPPTLFDEADLVGQELAQFWQSVDISIKALKPKDVLILNGIPMTVVSHDGTTVKLQTAAGEQQSYDLQRTKLKRDLAVALVERYFESSPPTGWRLIAAFLAIDRDGDVQRAEYYAQQADLRGFAANFLLQLIRHLSGDDPSDTPAMSFAPPPNSQTAVVNDLGPAPSEATFAELPGADDQQRARREVAPILKRQEQFPDDRWAAELVRLAASEPQLSRAGIYVLLDAALKRARDQRDIDTALVAIDRLAQSFGQDRAALRVDLLQSMSRRVKGEDRRQYVQLAQQFARESVVADDYAQAMRFAGLAHSLGRSVPDRFFRQSLVEFRQEVANIQEAFATLPTSVGDSETVSATRLRARFRVLGKGNFDEGMNELRAVDDPQLRALAVQESARPATAEQQLALGQGWFAFAANLSGLERTNAMRRADYWLRTSLPQLSRAQRIEAQRSLDAVAKSIGRSSDRQDLTELPPLDVSVGYGTFGINQNNDAAANPRVEPLPELDGQKITRFLWACARSRLVYLVPEDASEFRATGIVNAATGDGVVFRVRVDDHDLFVSPVINVMGGQVPVQVKLPAGAQLLELIVDPLRSNSFDHTYWVNPQLIFR